MEPRRRGRAALCARELNCRPRQRSGRRLAGCRRSKPQRPCGVVVLRGERSRRRAESIAAEELFWLKANTADVVGHYFGRPARAPAARAHTLAFAPGKRASARPRRAFARIVQRGRLARRRRRRPHPRVSEGARSQRRTFRGSGSRPAMGGSAGRRERSRAARPTRRRAGLQVALRNWMACPREDGRCRCSWSSAVPHGAARL